MKILLLWVFLAFLLTACSGSATSPTEPPEETTPQVTPKPTASLSPLPFVSPAPTQAILRVAVSSETAPFLTELDVYQGEIGEVTALVMGPAGERLVAGGENGVQAWSPRDGRMLRINTTMTGVRSFSYAPDGERLAAVVDAGRVLILDGASLGKIGRLDPGKTVASVAHHPAGQHLALALSTGDVLLWDLAQGEPIYTFKAAQAIAALAFSPDGRLLAAVPGEAAGAADPPALYLLDMEQGTKVAIADPGATAVLALAFAPDGRQLAAAGDAGMTVWRVQAGELEHAWSDAALATTSVAFSPDGRTVAAGDGQGKIHLWNARTGELLRTLDAHDRPVTALAFRPDGYLLFAASRDGTISVWGMPVP